MKKIAQSFFILLFTISTIAFLPASIPVRGSGALTNPPNPNLPNLQNPIFLPFLVKSAPSFSVSGQITDEQAAPLVGAAIIDSQGNNALTDANGNYTLQVPEGQTALAPSKDGYLFNPSEVDVSVNGNLVNQDFTASTACSEGVQNGNFESNSWWNLQSGEISASYSTNVSHGGTRSALTGILNPSNNQYGYSSVRSPMISIPAGSSSVTLRVWLYMLSTEATSAPASDDGTNKPALTDAPMMYDAQYVRVFDANNKQLATLMWVRYNNGFWTFQTFDLSAYAGKSIKLDFGSYNDNSDGVTAMYVDDVSLQMCGGNPPPLPPSGTCGNQMANSGFEYNGAWGIPNTPFPAAYSSDYAYSGYRSMRTGIPLYSSVNRYSYSDAWQTVYIPYNATSAVLKLDLLPLSTAIYAPDQVQTPPEVGAEWGNSPLASDAQYVLVLDPNTGVVIQTLLWWQPMNSTKWIHVEFNLIGYAGRSIRIQFGAFNGGYDGRTVMYVDNAKVDTCSGTPPPPPSGCTERIGNGGFENNSFWYIPLTAYSASYSTALARSGLRSMRSGIVYQAHNRFSYSDFRQVVSIPASSNSAVLSMWLYSISGETGFSPQIERPTAPENGPDSVSGDVQYLLVLDSWGNWLDTLIWQRSNQQYWRNFKFNLMRFAGQTVQLQWGTYNNGYSGVTSMFVDDVSLVACP